MNQVKSNDIFSRQLMGVVYIKPCSELWESMLKWGMQKKRRLGWKKSDEMIVTCSYMEHRKCDLLVKTLCFGVQCEHAIIYPRVCPLLHLLVTCVARGSLGWKPVEVPGGTGPVSAFFCLIISQPYRVILFIRLFFNSINQYLNESLAFKANRSIISWT